MAVHLSFGFDKILDLLDIWHQRQAAEMLAGKPPKSYRVLSIISLNYPVYSPIVQYVRTPEHYQELKRGRMGLMPTEEWLQSDFYKFFFKAVKQ